MVPLDNAAPTFGRLVRKDGAAAVPQAAPQAPPPEAPVAPAAALTPVQRQKQELRALCLARIDPASVAALPQEALFAEVERMIAEIADGIFRLSTFVPQIAEPAGFAFNSFLIKGEQPLLFHTGLRNMFPLNRDALSRIVPPVPSSRSRRREKTASLTRRASTTAGITRCR